MKMKTFRYPINGSLCWYNCFWWGLLMCTNQNLLWFPQSARATASPTFNSVLIDLRDQDRFLHASVRTFAHLNVVKFDLPELAAVPEAWRTDLFLVRVPFKVVVCGQFFQYTKQTEHKSVPNNFLSVAHLGQTWGLILDDRQLQVERTIAVALGKLQEIQPFTQTIVN